MTLSLLALTVLAFIAWRGWLRADALDAGPPRETGLVFADLVGAFAILFGAWLLAGAAVQLLGLLRFSTAAGDPTGVGRALLALGLQLATQLPVALYVLARAAAPPGSVPGEPPVEELPGKRGGREGLRRFGWLPRRAAADGPASRPGGLRRDLRTAAAALVLAVPLVMGVSEATAILADRLLGEPPPKIGHELLQLIAENASSPAALPLLLLSAVVLAPILEETIFRGLVQTALLGILPTRGLGRWAVVTAAAGCFTLVHAGQPWQILPALFVLGLMLGWLYERTGSLLPGILVHAAFNAFNVAVVLGGAWLGWEL